MYSAHAHTHTLKHTHHHTQVSLLRAKQQLKSAMVMNLESKAVVFEDIGRQVLGQGFKLSPEELSEKIGE